MESSIIREEAIDIHLLMEWIKDQNPIYGEMDDKDMQDLLDSGKKIISRMPLDMKEKKMLDLNKQIYFTQNMSWTKKTFELSELCNVMPYCGDIPRDILYFNDLSLIVNEFLRTDNSRLLNSKKKCLSMMKFSSLMTVPITVIQPSFIQRSNICRDAKNTKAYIEDGNHRAIALGLRGKSRIYCIAGIVNCNHCGALIEQNDYNCNYCHNVWSLKRLR
ncbi:MAG: hypothetical protein ACTSRB_18370 [Candidatus Helarchaeota archaeon]